MGSIICCPCRTVAKLFKPSDKFGKVLFCLPLALFGLICSLLLIGWGISDFFANLKDPNWPNLDLVIAIIIASLKIMMGVVGFFAILCRWVAGLPCLMLSYKILTLAILLSLIISWIYWGVELGKGWHPDRSQITLMTQFTITHAIYLAVCWWVLSCFASLQKVLSVGGTGWERRNWKEIVGDKVVDDGDYA